MTHKTTGKKLLINHKGIEPVPLQKEIPIDKLQHSTDYNHYQLPQ